MVTKSRNSGTEKKGRVRVGKLKVKKETVKDLSKREEKDVKVGALKDNLDPAFIRRTR